VHLENVSATQVKPGKKDDLVPLGDTGEGVSEGRIDLHPCLGRPLGPLQRSLLSGRELGADDADRT
jgi:hypothetical protein